MLRACSLMPSGLLQPRPGAPAVHSTLRASEQAGELAASKPDSSAFLLNPKGKNLPSCGHREQPRAGEGT